MICIIASNYQEAWTWARGQMLDKSEWFFPNTIQDLYGQQSFHVIVVGHHHNEFELYFKIAKERGRIGRK